jgi:hypothetical protein
MTIQGDFFSMFRSSSLCQDQAVLVVIGFSDGESMDLEMEPHSLISIQNSRLHAGMAQDA